MSRYTEDEVREMLDYCGYDVDYRQDWIEVGMIIKDYFGESGFNVWEDWSIQSNRYDAEDQKRVWKSFSGQSFSNDPNKIQIGTFIERAEKNGYQKPERFKAEELDFDDEISDDGEPPDYKKTPNERVKAKLDKAGERKKIETEKREQPNQSKQTTNNNVTTENGEISEEDKRLFDALTAEKGEYFELTQKAQTNLYNSEQALKYYSDRGISQETLLHYQCGWIEDYGYQDITGAYIPGTYEGFAIRNVNYEQRQEEIEQLTDEEEKKKAKKNNPKYVKPMEKDGAQDIPVGLKFVIQEPNLRDEQTGYEIPVFIFEGYVDVLSLYEATKIHGISLNGTGNIDKVIKSLKHFNINRPIVLLLDNDDTGKKANVEAYKKLKSAGFKVGCIGEFYADYKDANEFLVKDREGFIKAIGEAKRKPYEKYEQDLNRNHYQKFLDHVEKSKNWPTLETGFKTLDSKGFLNGGLRAGLYGIGALSSLGKTSFVLQLADNLATAGNPVLYFSLEMSRYELMAKSISRYTLHNSYDTKTYEPAIGFETIEILDAKRQADRVENELEYLSECIELYFQDTGDNLRIIEVDGEITVNKIREEVRKQVEITKKPPVVIVDYLQLIAQSPDITHNITDKQLIDINVKALKDISRVYNTPVIFISSFNRQSNNRESEFDSFLGSSGIEYSADVLLSLERDIELTEKQKTGDGREKFFFQSDVAYAKYLERKTGKKWLKLKVLKNRTGQALGEIKFLFDARYNKFNDLGEIKHEVEFKEPKKKTDKKDKKKKKKEEEFTIPDELKEALNLK